jgi:thiol-disulfide isomerase/thioredoxin
MKHQSLVALASALSLLTFLGSTRAADTNTPAAELGALMTQIRAKVEQGKTNESDFATELKTFDTLLVKHKGEKTDDVAGFLRLKAQLYFEIFQKRDQAIELIEQLKRDFPETDLGKQASETIDEFKRAILLGGKFPDFSEKDLDGKPLSVAKFKGKVVLVDFWATWCGPCVAELPNVLKAYEDYHAKGFEIVGISLDSDEQKTRAFIKERKISWPQYYDGKGWDNKLAVQYGVHAIPATYLLDGEGKVIGRDLRGEDLTKAIAKALAPKT